MHVLFLDLHALDPVVYRTCVVQNGMNEECSRQRKREKVDYRVGTREVQRTVRLVIAEAEPAARGVKDSRDIVLGAEAVVRGSSTDRHICEVPGL